MAGALSVSMDHPLVSFCEAVARGTDVALKQDALSHLVGPIRTLAVRHGPQVSPMDVMEDGEAQLNSLLIDHIDATLACSESCARRLLAKCSILPRDVIDVFSFNM